MRHRGRRAHGNGSVFDGTGLDQVPRQQVGRALQNFEVGEKGALHDVADRELAVDPPPRFGLGLPDGERALRRVFFAHDEVQALDTRRSPIDGLESADLLLQERPLVDHLRGFHQDRVGRDGSHVVRVVVDHALLAEPEPAVLPPESRVDDPRDLEAQGLPQLLRVDQPLPHEQESHALLGLFLNHEDPVELLLRHVSGADQQIAQAVLEPPCRRLGGNDLAAEKRDRDGVVFALDDEDARLALQAEHLEDVGQREDLERPLKTHWKTSSPPAGPAPRRTPPGARRG